MTARNPNHAAATGVIVRDVESVTWCDLDVQVTVTFNMIAPLQDTAMGASTFDPATAGGALSLATPQGVEPGYWHSFVVHQTTTEASSS